MKYKELRKLRISLGLTQREMAGRLGYAWSHYQRMEYGKRAITERLIASIPWALTKMKGERHERKRTARE